MEAEIDVGRRVPVRPRLFFSVEVCQLYFEDSSRLDLDDGRMVHVDRVSNAFVREHWRDKTYVDAGGVPFSAVDSLSVNNTHRSVPLARPSVAELEPVVCVPHETFASCSRSSAPYVVSPSLAVRTSIEPREMFRSVYVCVSRREVFGIQHRAHGMTLLDDRF